MASTTDDIARAESIGEIVWALRLATAAARKATGDARLAALRRIARLELTHADDIDLPWVARAAKAWTRVSGEPAATPRDHELTAWSELLANRPRKAKAASAAAGDVPVLAAALAWAHKRADAKRKAALVSAALVASPERRTLAARALHQALECPPELAAFLPTFESTTKSIEAHRARVDRVRTAFGETSLALEMPLLALAHGAAQVGEHAIAVAAYRKLDAVLAKRGSSRDIVADRLYYLSSLRRSLLAQRLFDEALAVVDRADSLRAKHKLFLVPDHSARALVYDAAGDWEHAAEHFAAHVAQAENGPPPAYGPGSSNARNARTYAIARLRHAGREDLVQRWFPV